MIGIVLELTDAELFVLVHLLELETEFDKYNMDDEGVLSRLLAKVKEAV